MPRLSDIQDSLQEPSHEHLIAILFMGNGGCVIMMVAEWYTDEVFGCLQGLQLRSLNSWFVLASEINKL